MEYKRLTDEKEHYKKCVGCSYRNCQYCEDKYEYAREVHKRLAELEDKIEQGTLIELPCKVGDTVYKIMHVCGKRRIVQFEVSRISIYEKEICVFFHKSKESWHEWCTKPHHFGGNIFLTREEAEKRLKELQE